MKNTNEMKSKKRKMIFMFIHLNLIDRKNVLFFCNKIQFTDFVIKAKMTREFRFLFSLKLLLFASPSSTKWNLIKLFVCQIVETIKMRAKCEFIFLRWLRLPVNVKFIYFNEFSRFSSLTSRRREKVNFSFKLFSQSNEPTKWVEAQLLTQ